MCKTFFFECRIISISISFLDKQINHNDSDGVYMFRHILHRALSSTKGNDLDIGFNDSYLSDILYLSQFLENYVVMPQIIVKDVAEIEIEDRFNITFYETWEHSTNSFYQHYIDEDRSFLDDEFSFALDEEYLFQTRIKNDPTFQFLPDDNSVKIIRPNIRVEFDEMFKLGLLMERKGADLDYYVIMSMAELIFANDNDLSIVPDLHPSTIKALQLCGHQSQKKPRFLKSSYDVIAQKAHEDLSRINTYTEDKSIILPPITSIVFNESGKLENLFKVATEVRNHFGKLRSYFSECKKIANSSSSSIKEALEALDELQYYASELSKGYKSHSILEISRWRDLTNFSKLTGGINLDDLGSVSNILLNEPLKYAGKRMKNNKIRYLFNLQKQFYSIENYSQMIEDLFGKKICPAHINLARNNGHIFE
jgi:hypothetical protein